MKIKIEKAKKNWNNYYFYTVTNFNLFGVARNTVYLLSSTRFITWKKFIQITRALGIFNMRMHPRTISKQLRENACACIINNK